ncbi:MAG: HAMP domain-containing histidine kinase [Lachnospiraceae bacterium]|nr:HAMP domain-containing histidine kinase [Lachnospiraceae bacterium]
MMLTIGIYWVINSLFLQRYYILDKENSLKTVYTKADALIAAEDKESEEFRNDFIQLCSSSNLNAAIVTTGLETVVSTAGDNNFMIGRLFDHVFDNGPVGRKKPVVLFRNDRYEICIADDPRMGIDYLELWGTLSNSDIIIMRTTLSSIRESVGVSNRFLGYIGFVMVALSGIIIWFVAGKITKPIGELAELSERMSALDFEAKYTSGGRNEIGVLGEHMNELSETLEKTVSELKTSNNELKRDIEKKEKQNSMRLEFLSNVAHELKTPIALIQGYAEGLKDGVAETDDDREYYCGVIIDESEKMNKLVKNLMTLNELEFGSDKVSLERFDLTELVRGCIAAQELVIKQKDIRIDFDIDKPVYVWSDEFKTEQVFTNYLSNAVHYCEEPADSSVTGDKDRRISVRFTENGDLLRVSVFNTGKPVPEEARSRLFEKFYKVDKARSREYGGSGIGLSIVKAIMDALNKDYGVNNYDNGVEFWFELDHKGIEAKKDDRNEG